MDLSKTSFLDIMVPVPRLLTTSLAGPGCFMFRSELGLRAFLGLYRSHSSFIQASCKWSFDSFARTMPHCQVTTPPCFAAQRFRLAAACAKRIGRSLMIGFGRLSCIFLPLIAWAEPKTRGVCFLLAWSMTNPLNHQRRTSWDLG